VAVGVVSDVIGDDQGATEDAVGEVSGSR